jgi:HK97 gp10 family phage protein
MAREIFKFDLTGIEAMTNKIDQIDAELDRKLDETLTKLALKVIADAKRLAPLDSGDLEAALNVDDVKKTLSARYIEFGSSPAVDHYAVAQHEGFMKRNGKMIQFSPGEKTLSKGAYNGYMPGAKFLENAVKMNEQLIIEELTKALYLG